MSQRTNGTIPKQKASKIVGIQFSILSPDEIRRASVAEINTKLEELFGITESNARKQNESNKVHTKNSADAFNEIQQLKNNLKALGQDPNFLNRY